MNEFHIGLGGPFTLQLDQNDRVRYATYDMNTKSAVIYWENGPGVHGPKPREFLFINARGTPYSPSGFGIEYVCSLSRYGVPTIRVQHCDVMAAPGSGIGSRQAVEHVELQDPNYMETWHLYATDIGKYPLPEKPASDWTQAEALAELADIIYTMVSGKDGPPIASRAVERRVKRVQAAIEAHQD